MAELTTSAGLPPPEIEDAGGGVTVRFRHSQQTLPERDARYLSRQQQAILTLLDRAGTDLALREIQARLEPGANLRRLREDLVTLKTRGLATPTGHGRGARWKRVRK